MYVRCRHCDTEFNEDAGIELSDVGEEFEFVDGFINKDAFQFTCPVCGCLTMSLMFENR